MSAEPKDIIAAAFAHVERGSAAERQTATELFLAAETEHERVFGAECHQATLSDLLNRSRFQHGNLIQKGNRT